MKNKLQSSYNLKIGEFQRPGFGKKKNWHSQPAVEKLFNPKKLK